MKILIGLLLLSSSAIANERVEFNQQTFVLKNGFCMSVFKGESRFGWCVTSFSTAAEQRIAILLAEKIAFEACQTATVNCEWIKSICAN